MDYVHGTVTSDFLRRVAQLSPGTNGPIRAQNFLQEHGIGLEFVPHLPRTYLDGAALRLPEGRPVIGLSLRYDRIDNFWFCLLHELAHVSLHLEGDETGGFVDDLTLRDVIGVVANAKEEQADEWAEEALIPREVWKDSVVKEHPTGIAVMELAHELGVHPAIVAGRVRYEHRNCRLLSQFVGTGQIRPQFVASV